jgi:hypothetical protein
MIGVVDLALAAGFAAVFLLTFTKTLTTVSLRPVHDPYLAESLALHSYEAFEEQGMLRDRHANRALWLSTVAFAISFSVWGLVGSLAPAFREMYHLSALQTSLLIAVPVLLGRCELDRVVQFTDCLGVLDRIRGHELLGGRCLCLEVVSS